MGKYKLLIFPIFKSQSWMRKFGYKKLIENSSFKIGIKVKNADNKPFNGAKIKNILIHESSVPTECAIRITSDKEIEIPNMNPDEVRDVWFETYSLPFSGVAWIQFNLESEKDILTYQWDKVNKCQYEFGGNFWSDAFLVKDENILQQKITNVLIVSLTILILIFSILRAVT